MKFISLNLFLNNIFHSLKYSNKTHIDIDFVNEQIKININNRIKQLKEEFKNNMIQMGISNESMEKIIDNVFFDDDIKPDSDMVGLFGVGKE